MKRCSLKCIVRGSQENTAKSLAGGLSAGPASPKIAN
jgi:hypothetical protein